MASSSYDILECDDFLQHQELIDDHEDEADKEEPDDEINRRTENEKLFNYQLKESILKCGCILYVAMGIALCVGLFGTELELNKEHGVGILKFFISLVIVCYIMNILLIAYNRIINNKESTATGSIISRNVLLCAFIIPFFAVSVLYLLLQMINLNMSTSNSYNVSLILTIFYFLFLISVIILVVGEGRHLSSTYPTADEFVRRATITITCVGLFVSALFYLTLKVLSIFLQNRAVSYNVTYSNNEIPAYLNNHTAYQNIRILSSYLFPIHLAFLVVSIIYLVGSLYHSTNSNGDIVSDPIFVTDNSRRWDISYCDILPGLVILILSLVIIPLQSIPDTTPKNGTIVYTVHCFIYLFGVILSLLQIWELQFWPKSNVNQNSIINQCFILIGGFGQIIFFINYISITIEKTSMSIGADHYKYSVLLQSTLLTSLLLLCIEVLLQNVVVHLASSRIPQVPSIGSAARNYCPSIGMLSLNLGCILTVICLAPIPSIGQFKSMSIDLFQGGLHSVAIILLLVYRVHGSVFFIVLLKQIHN